MTDLTPDAREIVELGRDLDDPSDDDRDRHRARLVGRLGAAAALTISIPAGASTTVLGAGSTAAVAGGALAKTAIVFALLGGMAGGAVCALGEVARPYLQAPAVATQVHAAAPNGAPLAIERSREAVPAASPAPEETAPAAAQPSPSATIRREAREAPPLSAPQQVSSAPTLQEEVDLIRRAHEALRANDPALALRYVAEHAARFPSGALTQERAAARALAVCSLHRPGAAEEARAFLAARPDSPLAARVRAACGL